MPPSRLIVSLAAAVWLCAATADALDPNSPQVKRLIKSGLKYLDVPANGPAQFEQRVGGQCLVGMCFFKDRADAAHPHVVEAVRRCQAACRVPAAEIGLDIYSTGIAIVFLCEVDAEKHASEIATLVESLILRQKEAGAWGYPSGPHGATCDTSMTQYAVLGLWTARHHNVAVSDPVIVAACNWLIRTQDPSGGWGYQGIDPLEFRRVEQKGVRRSLTAAGLGSSYMCAELLGLRNERPDRSVAGLPAAFQRAPEKVELKKQEIVGFEPKRLRAAIADGNHALSQDFKLEGQWLHYYMYALERSMSFRELVEGRSLGDGWYDRGVDLLAATQAADGSWQSNAGALVDTAFAVLFLMRGTKKTIEKTVGPESLEGVLVGGRGLPKDTTSVRVVGGRIVGASLATSLEEMLQILEDPEHEAFDNTLAFPPELRVTASDPRERTRQIERLARLATTGSPGVRKVAVQTLAASGRLEVAPVLIAALEDRDESVTAAACDGLLRISRKFEGYGPAAGASATEKSIAAAAWRKWYESVVP